MTLEVRLYKTIRCIYMRGKIINKRFCKERRGMPLDSSVYIPLERSSPLVRHLGANKTTKQTTQQLNNKTKKKMHEACNWLSLKLELLSAV